MLDAVIDSIEQVIQVLINGGLFSWIVLGVGAAFALLMVAALSINLFRGVRNSLRAFRRRDRSVSVPRHAIRLVGRGAVVAGREVGDSTALLIRLNSKDADLTRELGGWPAIYRRDYGFVLKARFLDPPWVHFPEKAAAWTGGICFFLGVFGTSADIRGICIGAVAFGIGYFVSRPFWGLMAYTRLVVTIDPASISWHSRTLSGTIFGHEGDWRLETNPQHPLGQEEQRLHSEALRTGAINPKTPYVPAYHNASLLVAQSGYRMRDWQAVAAIADDYLGKRSYRLKTAIERLHELSLEEARQVQRVSPINSPVRRMR